jgi:hypothetical protein
MTDAEARVRLASVLEASFNALDHAEPDVDELLAAIENPATRLTVTDHIADVIAAMIGAVETLKL